MKTLYLSRRKVFFSLSLTLALVLAIVGLALADNVKNDVVSDPASIALTASDASSYVDVQFYIQPTSGDGDPQCNFDTVSEQLIFTINTPSGVTANPSSLTFNKCHEGNNKNEQSVRFSANSSAVSGNISFTETFNNTGGNFNYTNAVFYINVVTPPPADSTPPVITPTVSGTLGNNGWYTSDVTVSWTVSDPESSISSSSGCGSTTINTDTAGQTLTCSVTSAGGTNSQSVTIKRDATAPTISGYSSPAANSNGWNNSDVTVSFSCSDATSGVASCGPDQTISGERAGQSATGTAIDNAGNSNSATVSGINIDKTAPTASASASPAANANGWNNTDVTVSFSGSDGLSGIDFCSASVVLSSEGTGQSASGTCTDKAGNVSALATASNINIDKTAPTLAPTVSPNPVYLYGSATASPNASDSLSGVDSASCGVPDTSSVGSKSVSCSATDKAGNTATASASYSVIYNWSGFFRPVDNPGEEYNIFNKVKAGQAIPVKFSLSGYQGLSIFAGGYPKSVVIACTPGATAEPIDETVTAGQSSLSYDALADQYIYVWKTDKAWAGTCRQLNVTLNDGTVHLANFQFTK